MLKEYLENTNYHERFNPDLRVGLNTDGWLENEIKPNSPVDLIERRGIFYTGYTGKVGEYRPATPEEARVFIINN